MRRTLIVLPIVVGLLLAATSAAAAATRTDVTIDVVTTFDALPDAFTATGLEGCTSGTVENGMNAVQIRPGTSVFAGFKVFTCDGSDSGFVVRLNARFGADGSVGSWAIVGAWGSLEGLRGYGDLTGEPIENGILDHYVGTTIG